MTVKSSELELKSADDGDATAVVTKALSDLTASVNGRLDEIEKKADTTKIADRLDKIELRVNRINIGGVAKNDGDSIEKKAFDSYARRGVERMAAEEAKALSAGHRQRRRLSRAARIWRGTDQAASLVLAHSSVCQSRHDQRRRGDLSAAHWQHRRFVGYGNRQPHRFQHDVRSGHADAL